jgi:hypothetical protein
MKVKAIGIAGVIYAVAEVDRLLSDSGTEVLGQAVLHEARIEINARQDRQVKLRTLWHEVLHAVEQQLGWRQDDALRLEEHQIDALANTLVQILRDNPDLVALTMEARLK